MLSACTRDLHQQQNSASDVNYLLCAYELPPSRARAAVCNPPEDLCSPHILSRRVGSGCPHTRTLYAAAGCFLAV